MATVQNLIDEVRAMLKDTTANTNATVLSDSELIAYFKRSINELCFSTDVNNRLYTYTFTAADTSKTFTQLTGGVESALFEYQYLLYHSVNWAADEWGRLYIVSPLDNLLASLAASDIKSCIIYDSTLTFNSAMAVGDKVAISGKWKKTDIASVADTYPLDSACEFASVAYVNAMGLYKKSQMDAGDRWMQIYSDRRAEIEKRVKKLLMPTAPAGLTLRKESSDVFGAPFFYISRTINA